jgi:hypothetical protein
MVTYNNNIDWYGHTKFFFISLIYLFSYNCNNKNRNSRYNKCSPNSSRNGWRFFDFYYYSIDTIINLNKCLFYNFKILLSNFLNELIKLTPNSLYGIVTVGIRNPIKGATWLAHIWHAAPQVNACTITSEMYFATKPKWKIENIS